MREAGEGIERMYLEMKQAGYGRCVVLTVRLQMFMKYMDLMNEKCYDIFVNSSERWINYTYG